MPFVPALGVSDFRSLRESGAGYVDKTAFISQLLADPTEVVLFPRPRRFGKTLNLSALAYFLQRRDEDLSHLFQDLAVWSDPNARAHFQQHPVVLLSFKDIKATSYASALRAISNEMQRLYGEYHEPLRAALQPDEGGPYRRILGGEATEEDLWRSLRDLIDALARHHGRRVVVLIDEYDTPIQSGYLHGFFDEVTLFFRNFLSAALKDNPSLLKGVLTGVLRVARENLFSGLNNVFVHSILGAEYSTAFGFTEPEVAAIVAAADIPGGAADEARLRDLAAWYDGYLFGGEVVYNPWSILSYLKTGKLRPHWVNTSSNELLRDLLTRRGAGLSHDMEALLRGDAIEARIDEHIALRDVDRRPEALWNFLLFAGYLKPVTLRDEDGELFATLAIPNLEVKFAYRDVFRAWIEQGLPESRHLDMLLTALLTGDAPELAALLEHLLLTVMSFQDPPGREPEKLYHGLILGLLVQLEGRFDVRSNRESGFGRADVLIRPRKPGQPGVVLELKVPRRGETPEQALLAAARQIRDRRYAAELTAAGATPVQELCLVFDGKRAWVRRVDDVLAEAPGEP